MSAVKENIGVKKSHKIVYHGRSHYDNHVPNSGIIDSAIKKVFRKTNLLEILPEIVHKNSDDHKESSANKLKKNNNQYNTDSKVVDDLLYIREIVIKALTNLLNIRGHLLLQLNLACGNITETYFDEQESKYLTKIEKKTPKELKKEIETLRKFTSLKLDNLDILDILNCSINDLENALNKE
jgi:hypothetical protein